MVEVVLRAGSKFVFVAAGARSLAALGPLPPRSIVMERNEALVSQLCRFLEAQSGDGDSGRRLFEVNYLDALGTLVFRFMDGRSYAVGLGELEGSDATPVTKVSLSSDGYAALIDQESGNQFEVPWDVVLYHAEPEYPFRQPDRDDGRSNGDRQRAPVIGRRIRLERTKRHWTLADLSARTGMKVPNLSRLEKGRHLPSLETLEKVADAFDMPVAVLVSARPS